MPLTFPSYGRCVGEVAAGFESTHYRLVLLAFLNISHLLLLIITSGKVPAPLIIILLQATVPFTTVFSSISAALNPQSTPRLAGLNTVTRESFSPRGRCSEWYASILILVAVGVALVPVMGKDKEILGMCMKYMK